VFYAFIVVPRFLRDAAYNLVEKYRFRLFGRSEQCMLPSGEDADRFVG
jgi:predicted DCC family thiol-disulfide oxidoreductase YuxK